jgi:beta-galactosidase
LKKMTDPEKPMNELAIPGLAEYAFGGDYNPEQWSESVWVEDMALMREAGVNLVTIGVFSWAKLQPTEKTWSFEWLDRILDLCHTNGISVDLATATASPPPWLGLAYPSTLAVDESGVRMAWGARQHYSPSSSVFKDFSLKLVEKMVERYADHPAIVMWHVGNEYGAHTYRCFSEESEKAFRLWLRQKYGDVDTLNERWGTAFWSQWYSSWEEVMPPRKTVYFPNPAQQLDFKRFSSDAMLDLYKGEVEVIRRRVGNKFPITTNFMRFFPHADYWNWSKDIDVISDDWYPDLANSESHIEGAMGADLMRSLGAGKPWLLMEQATSAINWREVNPVKPKNAYRRWSLQQTAHGADGILHFQWRASVRGAEKWHSGMLPHSGTDTKVWREVSALGRDLKKLKPLLGARSQAQIAIVLDWNSWWALELDSRPSTRLSQMEALLDYYRPLAQAGYSVDFAHPEQDLSKYKLVIAPSLYLISDLGLERIREAAEQGTNLVFGKFSGAVDAEEGVRIGGHLIGLRDVFGCYTEEWHPLLPEQTVEIDYGSSRGVVTGWTEHIRLLPGSHVEATFQSGDLEGLPAIVSNSLAKAKSWYLGCTPNREMMSSLLETICKEADVAPLLVNVPDGVEVTKRANASGEYLFLLNHTNVDQQIEVGQASTDILSDELFSGSVNLNAGEVRVLRLPK